MKEPSDHDLHMESLDRFEDFCWMVEAISREMTSGIFNNALKPHEIMFLAQRLQNKAKNQLRDLSSWKNSETVKQREENKS